LICLIWAFTNRKESPQVVVVNNLAASGGAPIHQSTVSSLPSGDNQLLLMEKLEKLGQLRNSGVLTEEEFAEQKSKLLDGPLRPLAAAVTRGAQRLTSRDRTDTRFKSFPKPALSSISNENDEAGFDSRTTATRLARSEASRVSNDEAKSENAGN
jgi:hypothetical protein